MTTTQEIPKSATIRISRERKELIAKYATVAGFLYGVISTDEFVEVFNHYEETPTTAQEAWLALERFSKAEDVEYSLFDNCISGPRFIPELPEDLRLAKLVSTAQQGKPRYLPDKDEFLRYFEYDYREPAKPYDDLKSYILRNKLTSKDIDGYDVNSELINLREMIQGGVRNQDIIDYFTESGYKFPNMDVANEFFQKVMNAHNHTRLFENNGFTPNEIFEKYERPKLIPLPDEPFSMSSLKPKIIKVGRNEPCPCGSGLKYKKCHGR
jgi:hypothetical protein